MTDEPEKKHDPVFRIHGNVGRDPEEKQAGKSSVVEFSIACDKTYDRESETVWFRIAVWKPELQQLVLENVSKGSRVAVEGFLRKNPYEDKNGNQRVSLDVSATRVGLIEWFQTGSSRNEDAPVVDPYENDLFDDLPF